MYLLVDTNNLLWRCLYTQGPLTPGTVQLGASKTLLRMIARFRRQFSQRKIVLFWDNDEGPIERRKIYPDYKKKKNDPEYLALRDNAIKQRKFLQMIFAYVGIEQYVAPNWEADDAIGSYLKQNIPQNKDTKITIISNDKDLFQLLHRYPGMEILRPINKGNFEIINNKNCEDNFGVHSSQIVRYKGLVGDKSDNIPGCKGIGPKTAIKILKNEDWAKVPSQAYALSYDLALIRHNIEIKPPNNLKISPIEAGRILTGIGVDLSEYFQDLNLMSPPLDPYEDADTPLSLHPLFH